MDVLALLTKTFLFLTLLILLLGLWRPVIALWWLDYQNRRRVLKYYGSTLLLLLAIWTILHWLQA